MWKFISFELRYRIRRPATYIYFFIFFLFSFLAISSDFVTIGGATGNINVNSPYIIGLFVSILSVFGIFVTSAVMGVPVYRDLEHKASTFIFSLPFSRSSYLFGRFIGSYIILVLIFLSIALGIILGSAMPWVDQQTVGPFIPMAYISAYGLILLPNLLFTGFIFFGLVNLTRNIVAAYTGSALLFITYLIANSISSDLENKELVMLLDAYGIEAFNQVTRYFTPDEKNTLPVPATSLLVLNRIIWVGLGLAVFLVSYFRFNIPDFIAPSRKSGSGKRQKPEAEEDHDEISIPRPSISLQPAGFLRRMFALGWGDFRAITRDVLFLSILLAGVIFLFLDGWYADQLYGTRVFPETYLMVEIGTFNYILLAFAVLIFFTGELVWKDRRYKMAQIVDATPSPTWMLWGSKFISIFFISILLSILIMIAGMATQTVKGYYLYDINIYLKEIFLNYLPKYLIFATFCFVVHTLANNKFVSFFLIITLFLAFALLLPNIGWDHRLYRFLSIPGYTISKMNGYGHFWVSSFWFTLYWIAFGVILMIVSHLMWVRGTDTQWKNRLKMARRTFAGTTMIFTFVSIGVFLVLGGFIYYNTNVLNEYRTEKAGEKWAVNFEKTYDKFKNIPQPRIVASYVETDLFPADLRLEAEGKYTLVNEWQTTIDSVHILSSRTFKMTDISFDRSFDQAMYDEDYEYRIFYFDPPILPGDTLTMNFGISYAYEGFPLNNAPNGVVYNGSFVNSGIFPSIGYAQNYILRGKRDRRKYDLEPLERLPDVNDSVGRLNTYLGQDGDWIDFETVVSTDKGQVAIAPGYLQREWEEGDRVYFHYKMDAPILNFYSYLSADYEVYEDEFTSPYFNHPVAFQIYYQKGHEYNLERMRDGARQALEYASKNFSPYQHRQARILEFPRYASFAQSFPNTIPYSEAIGFIARVDKDDPEDVDFPFYVTAHEIAHQWWAHQVIGGAVQGATVMSETMSQYTALMVLEKEYGREQMRKFLEYELDRYLSGRAAESERELPLLYNENQGYIHYRKGSVVMYALKEYIGEDSLNAALRRYVEKYAFQDEPPFTNSLEFMSYIREVTPDSLHYLLDDMFEKITLYENRATGATATPKDGGYEVTLDLSVGKYYADTLGRETPEDVNDYIEVGVFADKELTEILYLQKHKLSGGEQTITVQVDKEPARAGIDPYLLLIDRIPDDNVTNVKVE